MVKTLSQRKTELIEKVYAKYGNEAKLLKFNYLDRECTRLALWFKKLDEKGEWTHGAIGEEKEREGCYAG